MIATQMSIGGYGLVLTTLVVLLLTGSAFGHCDSMNGPVVQAAEKALQSGEFTGIQIWVGPEQEAELRKAFEQSREVRKLGGEAEKLADRYFYETAVRLHRAAEGMPYTGLKPAGPMPEDIQVAEEALQTGDVKPVNDMLATELRRQVGKWHTKAVAARKRKDQSVEAGREYVDAYVEYVVYVHALHQNIQAGPPHGVGD